MVAVMAAMMVVMAVAVAGSSGDGGGDAYFERSKPTTMKQWSEAEPREQADEGCHTLNGERQHMTDFR